MWNVTCILHPAWGEGGGVGGVTRPIFGYKCTAYEGLKP